MSIKLKDTNLSYEVLRTVYEHLLPYLSVFRKTLEARFTADPLALVPAPPLLGPAWPFPLCLFFVGRIQALQYFRPLILTCIHSFLISSQSLLLVFTLLHLSKAKLPC